MIETFATDEHRIGLKPILRRVWAPRGERPVAVGHHRFEWLYVTAFVSPATGESFWYLSTGVSKEDFEAILALFAREAGAGRDRIIILVLDNAGWHSSPGLVVPEGIRLVYPAALHPRAPARRDPLGPCRRADRQPALRHPRRSRRRRRRAVRRPHRRPRPGQGPGRLPLVARSCRPELISRMPYDFQGGGVRGGRSPGRGAWR